MLDIAFVVLLETLTILSSMMQFLSNNGFDLVLPDLIPQSAEVQAIRRKILLFSAGSTANSGSGHICRLGTKHGAAVAAMDLALRLVAAQLSLVASTQVRVDPPDDQSHLTIE